MQKSRCIKCEVFTQVACFTLQIYDIAVLYWILYPYSEYKYMCVCVCVNAPVFEGNDCWEFFFFWSKRYYGADKKDHFGSLSCFIHSERLLQTAPTSKLVLQYQATVFAQLPLTDYSGVSALRILERDKQ